MPRVIHDTDDGVAISLDELVDALDAAPWDARDEDAFAAMGVWLARLARNRTFLSDLAIGELERRFAGQQGNSYGAQVLMLRAPGARYALRANFWPALNDAVVRAGGTAPFFYDLPHDHNFSFLTVGYLGPGYWSDYYLFDGDRHGDAGDPARLVFDERARLEQGKLMLYRAHRDVHVQLPPDSFSVSLNVLGYDRAQPWRTQYRFDVASNTIAQAMTATPSEALVTVATHLGGEAGIALAADLAMRHPHPRMRRTARACLAGVADEAMTIALDERLADDRDAMIARAARARLG
ncbi:transposase [Sphingomonas adhaesiva]|uniref:transposase n=1 Tax=Sphingomonas adhaesiva TaxID=28212 RepID=UPI002FF8EB1C